MPCRTPSRRDRRAPTPKARSALHRETQGQGPASRARERWIISNMVKYKGAPNKVIADELRISPHTLRNHLASIYAKLRIRRRLELVPVCDGARAGPHAGNLSIPTDAPARLARLTPRRAVDCLQHRAMHKNRRRRDRSDRPLVVLFSMGVTVSRTRRNAVRRSPATVRSSSCRAAVQAAASIRWSARSSRSPGNTPTRNSW